uniref:Uncharacterized protein n=1 Tax=Arundo donax TaxID=35708 RepID=A0A0A9ACE4_ARUDO
MIHLHHLTNLRSVFGFLS